MPHDQKAVLRLHQLTEGVGLHTGFHAGGLLHLLRLAAEVLNPLPILYHSLVASASQSHIDGDTGVIVALAVTLPVHAEANA